MFDQNLFSPQMLAPWMQEWQKLQQQYTQNWQNGFEQTPSPMNSMLEAYKQWTQPKQTAAPNAGNDTINRVMASAQQFMGLIQASMQQFNNTSSEQAVNWKDTIAQAFQQMNTQKNPVIDAMHMAMGTGSKGYEQILTDVTQAFQPFKQDWNAMFRTPTLGYTREQQARHQQLFLAYNNYNEQLMQYQTLLLKASQRGIAIFENKLTRNEEPGKSIQSLRQLYDTYIDAAEEGYSEIALSDDFQQTYGALINAQMRVQQLLQQEVELMSGALGMPTRTEINAVHKKLIDIQRQLSRHAQANVNANDNMSSSPSRVKPTKKATPTKKTSIKKAQSLSKKTAAVKKNTVKKSTSVVKKKVSVGKKRQ